MPELCPNCGMKENPADAVFCMECGVPLQKLPPPPVVDPPPVVAPPPVPNLPSSGSRTLVLTGAEGVARFHISTDVGQRIYRSLSGEESRFVGTVQFHLIRSDAEDEWYILGEKDMPQLTLLNGAACEDRSILKNGDVISVGSRTDSGKMAAVVKVTFE